MELIRNLEKKMMVVLTVEKKVIGQADVPKKEMVVI
jgi:hypothetical protein